MDTPTEMLAHSPTPQHTPAIAFSVAHSHCLSSGTEWKKKNWNGTREFIFNRYNIGMNGALVGLIRIQMANVQPVTWLYNRHYANINGLIHLLFYRRVQMLMSSAKSWNATKLLNFSSALWSLFIPLIRDFHQTNCWLSLCVCVYACYSGCVLPFFFVLFLLSFLFSYTMADGGMR